MSSGKLSSAQRAQLEFLETLPSRFERIHRQVEELAALRANETLTKNLARSLDNLRNEAQGLLLTSLADTFGVMAALVRRGGGLQMRVRGLREGLVSLKTNYEGALRAATRPNEGPREEPADFSSGPPTPSGPGTGPPTGRP